jgi:hypothetical protein
MTFDHRSNGQPGGRPPPAAAGSSLNMAKRAAGGLAAATSAVLGSYFGVLGTVGGAAAGSVATALSSEIYQRSFERLGGRGRGTAPHPRTLPRLLLGTVVIFALGIGAVTGVEWIKGGPLSGGDRGTSLGRVLGVDLLPSSGGLIAPSERAGSPDSGSHDQGTRDHGVLGDLLSGLTG